jgi:phosphatidylglycerophosphate synthase
MVTAKAQDGGFRVKRIQTNVVALRERQLLTWLCTKLPAWVTPDNLTALGVAGAVLVFTSYIASRVDPLFLWLASFGLVVHWFGDSLDGSLARYRRIERPIYGYFLDHTIDALCNLLIMAGIGFTASVRMDVALFALLGYYLLCMYVFINNHLSGVFQLSFIGFGPTELRICLVAINTWMFFSGHIGVHLGGVFFSPYDFVLLFAGSMFTLIYVVKVIGGIRTLRASASNGASPADQSASMNVSSPSK